MIFLKAGKAVVDIDFSERMTGQEIYQIKGYLIPYISIIETIQKMKGLLLTANCLEKAIIVSNTLQNYYRHEIHIILGSICVEWNGTQYGYLYNPPFEFHAWNSIEVNNKQYKEKYIIDFSLPGVILRGQKMKDEHGGFLKGMPPFMLNGECPDFIKYEEHMRLV